MFENIFHFKKNNTDLKTEIVAGFTTFMTMAYILAVNPSILSQTGMDKGAVFTATILASIIGTLAPGAWPALSAARPWCSPSALITYS